jgi:hypothetical protein
VELTGAVAPELISKPGRVVVTKVSGMYDGTTLELDAPGELVSVPPPDRAFRNPCPNYQDEIRGDVNPSVPLQRLVSRLENEYAERIAGSWWDRARQTFTVRMTGDVSEISARSSVPSKAGRLCLLGNAKYSVHELDRTLEKIMDLSTRSGAWLVEAELDVVDNQLLVRIENVDAELVSRILEAAQGAVKVESFIELAQGELRDLPEPSQKGDIPLVTNPRRWSYGGMHALGHFSIEFDAAARCVYLASARGQRLLPVWPQGYFAYSSPFRVLDFDGRVVSRDNVPQPFGGGNVPLEALNPPPAGGCGAESAWIGQPSG